MSRTKTVQALDQQVQELLNLIEQRDRYVEELVILVYQLVRENENKDIRGLASLIEKMTKFLVGYAHEAMKSDNVKVEVWRDVYEPELHNVSVRFSTSDGTYECFVTFNVKFADENEAKEVARVFELFFKTIQIQYKIARMIRV